MMEEITTCEVINTEDRKKMTIITEWLNDGEVKITLLRAEMMPLIGETTITKLCEASRTEKAREEALQDIRNELTAKDKDVQFSLRETRLTWKKKIWKKGYVEMKPCEDIVTLVAMNIVWLSRFSSLQKTTFQLEEENKELKKNTEELTSKVTKMDKIKKDMEDSLNMQFLLLLNSKKRKIRELEEKLSNQKVYYNASKYDVKTDESDDNEEENVPIPRKRPKQEILFSPIASTSKKMCNISIKSSQESDDEIILRYDETQAEYATELNIEESPEEDIFSQ